MLGKTDTHTTLDTIPHHGQKLTKTPQLPTSNFSSPESSEDRHTQHQPHTETLSPTSSPSLSMASPLCKSWGDQTPISLKWTLQYPKAESPNESWGNQSSLSLNWTSQSPKAEAPAHPEGPGSCHHELNPTMSQSWSPSGSWDQTPISVDLTPCCPKGPRLSAWTQPQVFQKPKPKQVWRRPGFCPLPKRARCMGRRCNTPAGQGGELCIPCQPLNKCRPSCPHSLVGTPHPWGQFY